MFAKTRSCPTISYAKQQPLEAEQPNAIPHIEFTQHCQSPSSWWSSWSLPSLSSNANVSPSNPLAKGAGILMKTHHLNTSPTSDKSRTFTRSNKSFILEIKDKINRKIQQNQSISNYFEFEFIELKYGTNKGTFGIFPTPVSVLGCTVCRFFLFSDLSHNHQFRPKH